MATILLLSGPNLNLLGEREPRDLRHRPRSTTTSSWRTRDRRRGHGYELEHVQSNHEGELVDAIHGARGRCAAIVINAGAFTHYAYALADALADVRRREGRAAPLEPRRPRATGATTSVVAPVRRRHDRRLRRRRLPARDRGAVAGLV